MYDDAVYRKGEKRPWNWQQFERIQSFLEARDVARFKCIAGGKLVIVTNPGPNSEQECVGTLVKYERSSNHSGYIALYELEGDHNITARPPELFAQALVKMFPCKEDSNSTPHASPVQPTVGASHASTARLADIDAQESSTHPAFVALMLMGLRDDHLRPRVQR